jgi:hypothetical protein
MNQAGKQFRGVQPHGDIREVFENIFMVTGTNVINNDGIRYQTSRNMIILRSSEGMLSLINTVRLNEDGLKALNKLGTVKHVIRIGAFHGYDDPFYVDTYEADYWIMPNMDNEYGIENPKILSKESMPISNCSLFEFKTTTLSEGALLLEQDNGILISCDSIQNWTEKDSFFSDECWNMFKEQGLIGAANIPDTWVGACKPRKEDFSAIQALKFSHLISAHGEPLTEIASEKVSNSIKRVF